ncbi:unnamed protein product [Rhodiola kirilowii]
MGEPNKTTKSDAEAARSPFFLATTDRPGDLITTVQLKGENYEEWSKHVRNALRTKRKLGFVDGTIQKPTEAAEVEQWEVVNSMLVAWIMNTIEPSVRSSISMVEDVKTLWDDLQLLFSVGNGARVQELKADIANCKQNGDSVMIYYGRLKKLWDELAVYKPIRSCECGKLSALLQQDQDEDRLHSFLMGLDSQFGTIRSTLTAIEPLPKLAIAYQRVIREERQLSVVRTRVEKSDVVGFSAQSGTRPQISQNSYVLTRCSHCGKTGHEVTECYQKHGYPEWWGERGRGSGGRGRGRGGGAAGSYGRGRGTGARANAVDVSANASIVPTQATASHATRRDSEYDRAALSQLTDEQWTALLNFVKPARPDQVEKLNGKSELVDFIIDTGASHHMTWKIDYLTNVVDIMPCWIGLPDGDSALAVKQGDMCLGGDVWMRGVLYAPSLKCSLISVAKLLKGIKGSSITFTADLCIFQDRTKMMIGAGEESGGVYKFRGAVEGIANRVVAGTRDLWHQRLGHPSSRVLSYLPTSVSLNSSVERETVCDTCFRAKQTRECFSESDNKASAIFDLIHCDVWGPYRTPSTSGAVYFLTIVDDCSRAVWIFLMTEKREVQVIIRNFMAMVQRQFEKHVKVVRSDNGTEFMCMKSFFNHEGILHQTSCVGTPQQNGRVERKHRHILNVARALMFQAQFPTRFWGECVLAASHLINRTPTAVLAGKTPYEVLFGVAPSFDNLRVMGCLCYVHHQLRDKDKFAARSRKCVFTGYPYGKKGWQVYDLEKGEFFVSRDVVFHETIFPFATVKELHTEEPPRNFDSWDFPESQEEVLVVDGRRPIERDSVDEVMEDASEPVHRQDPTVSIDRASDMATEMVTHENIAETPVHDDGEDLVDEITEQLGRGMRVKHKNTRLNDYVVYTTMAKTPPSPLLSSSSSDMATYPIANYLSCDRFSSKHQSFIAAITVQVEPQTFAEAVRDGRWRLAMRSEIDALVLNHTWDLVDLPPGKKAIGCRWVYTIKFHSDGTIERFKARLVALGNRQKEGVDYDETFAPVVKMTTVRLFLKVAAVKQWEVHQMDVHNAFLHGDLEEEVYMKLPPGFHNDTGVEKVCKLKKSLYGLKQAPRCWFSKLATALKVYGFTQSKSDYSLFSLVRDGMQLYVLVYVDDLLVGGNDSGAIHRFKEYLSECFRMKDLGALKYFLGIEVARSFEGFYLSQRKYACDIVVECGLLGSKPFATPVEQHHHLTSIGDDYHDNPEGYRRLVGRLVYLMNTRPELSYIVHVLAQFMQRPQKKHWNGALRVVRYLKGSPGQGILLSSFGDLRLSAYCDADWQACAITRRSLSGFAVMLGDSPIAWKTQKQRVVSRSSAEAEYRSMADTLSELKWDRELLLCFGIQHEGPMLMYCDNQSALHIAANPVFHERTKHVESDCHFIRDEIQDGLLRTMKIHTTEQLADIFTKGLSSSQFSYLRRKLGICDLHAPT